MSLRSFVLVRTISARQKALPSPFWRGHRGLLRLLGIVGLLVAAFGAQACYQQQTGMIVGRPLASHETHLHTVVFSSRPGVVYLGTHFGLFTSHDSGQTWPQRQGSLNAMMITAVAVSPTNPDLLAVLSVPNGGSGGKQGIWVSADGGSHWHCTLPARLPGSAYPYAIQSASGSGGHFYVFFPFAGWFETRDLGSHWSSLTDSLTSTMQTSTLLIDPTNPAHLLMGGEAGLFETASDGKTWQQLTQVQGSIIALVGMRGSSGPATTVFCATDRGLYRGVVRAGQLAWSALSPPPAVPPTRLTISADGSALYALFGSNLWFSADQGTTWVQRGHFARSDLVALSLDPVHPHNLLAGFFWPGLVLLSTDQGGSWHTLTD